MIDSYHTMLLLQHHVSFYELQAIPKIGKFIMFNTMIKLITNRNCIKIFGDFFEALIFLKCDCC